jgi:hypothetical protein
MLIYRKAEVVVGDWKVTYPELHIEAEINFNDSSESNIGMIKLHNLSDKSIKKLKKDKMIQLNAGYEGDVGSLLPGIIIKTTTNYEGTDKVTEVIVGDGTERWLNATINKTWKTGITSDRIVKTCADMLPFNFKGYETDTINYPKGKTHSGTIKSLLEEIAADLGAKLHVSRGFIYFRKPKQASIEIVNLNKDTGLIGTPTISESDGNTFYEVDSLLNYRIWTDSIINIDSKTINGLYKVKGGSHSIAGGDFITTMEVDKYES